MSEICFRPVRMQIMKWKGKELEHIKSEGGGVKVVGVMTGWSVIKESRENIKKL